MSKTPEHQSHKFRNQGHEIQRIETLSDAVFAFAVTLLIVSLEVPKTFEELLVSMRGFVPFGICFTILLLIWYEQHIFFRRYGLDDRKTAALNGVLLFIVLFYVYPLKFLFSLMFGATIYGAGKSPFTIKDGSQEVQLMTVYGVGFMVIYLIFMLLYIHAYGQRKRLGLSSVEVFDTKTKIYGHAMFIFIGLLATLLALLLPNGEAGNSGLFYFVIGPASGIFYNCRVRMRRNIH
jgi:uncharacterized membrane protein